MVVPYGKGSVGVVGPHPEAAGCTRDKRGCGGKLRNARGECMRRGTEEREEGIYRSCIGPLSLSLS